jgi:hypothetical protein
MFAAVFILLYIAHYAADYPLQTDHQAAHKADRDASGWRANLAHTGTHILTSAALLTLIGWQTLGLHLTAAGTLAAIAWIGASHSVIDRRRGIAWWMAHTRQASFAAHGGAAHVDQTAHIALGLLPAALLLTLA